MTIMLEVDPGKRIPLHTHSAEKTITVLNGSAVATAVVEDRRSRRRRRTSGRPDGGNPLQHDRKAWRP